MFWISFWIVYFVIAIPLAIGVCKALKHRAAGVAKSKVLQKEASNGKNVQ